MRTLPVMSEKRLIYDVPLVFIVEDYPQTTQPVDWYKVLSEQKKKGTTGRNFAANVENKTGADGINIHTHNAANQYNITEMMTELLQLVKGQQMSSNPLTTTYANYAYCDDEFAGNVSTTSIKDQSSKQVLAKGSVHKRLYVLRQLDIVDCFPPTSLSFSPVSCSASSVCNKLTWHKRLGHLSMQTLKHISDCKLSNDTCTTSATNQSLPSPIPSPVLPSVPHPPIRRSTRTSQKLSWLSDFVSHHTDSSLLCSSNAAYMSFVASLSILQEPKSFAEAVRHSEWREAMDRELQAFETNCTWILTTLPMGKKAIGCKWVYKTKLKADGSVERYKARLVAKGYNQVEGIDYTGEFFSDGEGSHNVYMLPPNGYPVAPDLLFLLVYVADILITGPSLSAIQNVKDYLHALFTIKDLGDARYFLGLEIVRNPSGTYISQTKYVLDIVKDTKLLHSEAEYRSMAATVCELRWISYLLKDFAVPIALPVHLYCDNKAALHIMANPVFHERTKHIELDCHVVRDAYKSGFVAPSHIRGLINWLTFLPKFCR
ncbi:UNVERIFIED_CONTAM: Retrovirus-related Pol polyprotein from transposon RE2 [Sesamum radiatum]|uniref:Retrovirus-related Pol polyprotein from transposon RE2 n=1 Tax=Sesamum radiatum TaxID=300843 RepID=A0AAW2Q0A5_SESRA